MVCNLACVEYVMCIALSHSKECHSSPVTTSTMRRKHKRTNVAGLENTEREEFRSIEQSNDCMAFNQMVF
jgi:hypothetical protein